MTANDVIGCNRIAMSSGISGKKNFADWPYGSKVISKIKVKFWTGGGARGNDLDTPKLVYLMLGLSSIRMSNQNNFPAIGSMGCHRLPWRKKKKNNNKYSCKQQLPGPSRIRRQDMPTCLKVSDQLQQ